MEVFFTPLSPEHRVPVMDIFNDYVENSFAAFPETRLPYEFFNTLLHLSQGYPSAAASDATGQIIGFGMLRPYSPFPVFSKTAELTCFLKNGFTRQGIGKTLLDHLLTKGAEKGIAHALAAISSLNQASINFHLKNGFTECGRFKSVGCKKGLSFDVVYCQRML